MSSSAYDTGSRPFKHDVSRGKWLSRKHFYAACIAHAFGARYFSYFPLYIALFGGIVFLLQFVFGVLIFGAPLFFMESFLGQFSSSGYISVFRIAPLFKGIGYTILLFNILSVSYYVVHTAIPLIYLFGSINPTLPWMTCHNSWNTVNCTTETVELKNKTTLFEVEWSVEEYLERAICAQSRNETAALTISWRILVCLILVWIIIGVILIRGIEFIGKILYGFMIIILSIMGILFIRLLFVPRAHLYILDFFKPRHNILLDVDIWIFAPFVTTILFGSGWGSVLTMASYNNFREDIGKFTWLISIGNFMLFCVCGLWSRMIEEYLDNYYDYRSVFYYADRINIGYTAYPFFFATIEFSQLWSVMFFIIIFLGELSGCVIQILSILTAIFDEFESIRIYKKGFTLIATGFLFLMSLIYATNKGIKYALHLYPILNIIITILLFMELLVIIWIYGRERFQRDVEFMVKQIYSNWKFFLMRYITPLVTLILFFKYIQYLYQLNTVGFSGWDVGYTTIGFIIQGLPFLLFPIYLIWKLRTTTGSFKERFVRLCRPTDWYPADPVDRRNYEELLGAGSDTFKQIMDLEDIEFDDE